MAISVSFNNFTTAAQNAGGALRVTEDGQIQKSSGLREHFPTREMRAANRETTGQFLSALKAKYGEQIANMAAHRLKSHLDSGKPLTAHTVQSVVGKAEHLQKTALATFLAGATPEDGRLVQHSLDKAIDAWQKEHPHEPTLTQEERQAAKERMAENLLAGNPRCNTRKEMFQAVLNADLRPRLSGDVEIPGAPKGAAAVAARAAAAEAFKGHMASVPAHQLTLHLNQANGGELQPTFERDLIRDMDLTVNKKQVPNKRENLPTPPAGQPAIDDPARAVAQNAYEHFARFLFGADAHFADLSPEQQKQVYLLAGLCNQKMQTPAKMYAQNGLLNQIFFPNVSSGTSAQIQLEKRTDGNFALRYSGTHALAAMSTPDVPKGPLLDPGRSVQEVRVELVISPGELERLAALDWRGVSPNDIPDTYRMKFEECRLDSRFALYHEGAEPDAPEAAPVAAPTVAQEAVRAMDVFLLEMFPEDGKQPGKTSSAFRTACEEALAGRNDIDIGQLNPTNYYDQVHFAVEAVNAAAVREGRVAKAEELHAAASQAITRQLTSLSETLDAIDDLTEPANGGKPEAGQFSPAQKVLMKQVAMRHDVRNLAVLTTLMEKARERGSDMRNLSAPLATPCLLAQTAKNLSTAYASVLPKLGNPPPPNGMNIMLELAADDAGLDAGQLTNFAANLASDDAATVAGAFLLGRDGMPNVPPKQKEAIGRAWDMMRALHDTAAILKHGRVEVDQKLFSNVTPLHQMPGGVTGCMDVLSTMAGRGVISRGVEALAGHVPTFTEEEWNTLRPIADRLARGRYDREVAGWIAAAGEELLAATQENQGLPLDNTQVWSILTGESMPPDVMDENFAGRLYASLFARSGYQSEADFASHFVQASYKGGLTPKRMQELTQPGARLTLKDIRVDTHMSAPVELTPQNAYSGLSKDFFRMAASVPFTFMDARGEKYSIYNTCPPTDKTFPPADHQDIKAIVGWVKELTEGREAQTASVLEAMTQAGISLNVCAGVFGVQLPDFNANYSFSATQQTNGDVVMVITHDPALRGDNNPLPVWSQIQYTIHKNGSHECTGFEMQRVEINVKK